MDSTITNRGTTIDNSDELNVELPERRIDHTQQHLTLESHKPKLGFDSIPSAQNDSESNSSRNWARAILITSVLFLLMNISQTIIALLDRDYSPLLQSIKVLTCIAGVASSIIGIVGNLQRVPRKSQYAANFLYILLLTLLLVTHISTAAHIVQSPIYEQMSGADSARLIVPLCFCVFFIVALIAFIDLRVHVMLQDEKHSIV
jgi:hypothetical protein